MTIRFLDLQKINARFASQYREVLDQVLRTGYFIKGKYCTRFEEEFSSYCNANHCVGVGNGLEAIFLMFRAYIEQGRLKEGDEVLVPSNTYIASILSISQAGLIPILVEPKQETYNMDVNDAREKVSQRTRAILLVHLYGQAVEMDGIRDLAKSRNLLILEDAAQAHGARWREEVVGGLGDCSAFSFFPGKNLGALGDGGAVVTNDEELGRLVRDLGNYGSAEKYKNRYRGYNSRLDEMQAGFLLAKLAVLEEDNERRRGIAKRYLEEIQTELVILPAVPKPCTPVWHLFVIRTKDRNGLQTHLKERGVETLIHYPIAPHKQEAYSHWSHLSLPVSEEIHSQVLSLPLHPCLEDQEVEQVIEAVNSF
ncbi:DegT/DnrJ/EryC1/StrS family aminotransferase [bacterium]|jgi:dTDP-4-amino-4,6-dideoxygalactose transaminase|nr:DegT/DnrJ/EryC1/StrS family aminotransferase [bacterium]